jgi:hypothetical protein
MTTSSGQLGVGILAATDAVQIEDGAKALAVLHPHHRHTAQRAVFGFALGQSDRIQQRVAPRIG